MPAWQGQTAATPLRECWILCRAARADLVYLRYTLEAYEGLCVPTTLAGGEGWVALGTTEDRRTELRAVLTALAREIPLQIGAWLDRPPSPPAAGP